MSNLDTFFENSDFLERIDVMSKNYPHRTKNILNIMKEIKESMPELDIDSFICMIDKLNNPAISFWEFGGGQYKYSVELWNKFVFDSDKNFNLMISTENICY
jgi:hypothetical protein